METDGRETRTLTEFTFRKPVDGRAAVSHFFGARYQLSKAGAQRAAPSPRLAALVTSFPHLARPGKLRSLSVGAFNFTMRRTFPTLIWFRNGRTYARRERTTHSSLFLCVCAGAAHPPPLSGEFAGALYLLRECVPVSSAALGRCWKISYSTSLDRSRDGGARALACAMGVGFEMVRFLSLRLFSLEYVCCVSLDCNWMRFMH